MHTPILPSSASDTDAQPTSMRSNVTDGNASLAGPLSSPYYGYTPTEWTSICFVILFFITAVLHLIQAAMYRKWWLFPTVVLACCGEVVGWACRVWSSHSPFKFDPYLIQMVVLVISPTLLIATLFITFGKMCMHLGQQYSRLSPRLYAKIFLTSDIAALLVQSVGGGIAGSSSWDPVLERLGSHIILAGVLIQLVSLSLFCALVAEYVRRCFKDKPLKRATPSNDSSSDAETIVESPGGHLRLQAAKSLIIAVCLETALLYIRAVYRAVELSEGWEGGVARTQPLFVLFDGTTVLLATFAINVFHPGRILTKEPACKDEDPAGSRGPALSSISVVSRPGWG